MNVGNNPYIYLEADDSAEAERLFSGLADGAGVEMKLQRTKWAELFGSLRDWFRVPWMISFTGNVVFEFEQG